MMAFFLFLFLSLTEAAVRLSDIRGHQYEDSIKYLVEHGIVKWYDDGTFWPDRPVSRAEFMKIAAWASMGSGVLGSGSNCFDDVKRNDRFAPYVCYARERWIVKGFPGNLFKPNQNVSIAEALKMGLHSFEQPVKEGEGSQWYQPYMDFVHNNSIFSKYALYPDRAMTRGQMAYLSHQLMLEKNGALIFDGIRKVASAGCAATPPRIVPSSSVVNGVTRHYITVVGNKYNQNVPTKLIFAFHGRTNPNTMVRTYYKIEQASQGDAIIIYPAGLPEEWPSRSWSNPGDRAANLRDFALFDQLVEEFSDNYCINTDEIFVVWHSLGAWFTNSLACARGDVIRAIGSVGGGTTINNCRGPVAAMIMHNPEDNLASFESGITARDQLLRQNSCSQETIPVGPAGGNCVQYTCQQDAPVIRCPHNDSTEGRMQWYYPHTWPDFAWPSIWHFFESQSQI